MVVLQATVPTDDTEQDITTDDTEQDINNSSACEYISWSTLSSKLGNNRVSVLSLNIRSLTGKFAELLAHIYKLKNKFTFVVIVETWLTPDKDRALEIAGYRSHAIYRTDQIGGGIKLYYLENVNIDVLDQYTGCVDSCEILTVKASVPGFGNVNVVCVYRPPGKPINQFTEYIGNLLDDISDGKTILVGDFNIDALSPSDNHSTDYIDIVSSYGLQNVIDVPTYISPISGVELSSLDHICHNLRFSCNSFVIEPALADHYAVACIFDANSSEKYKKIQFRDVSAKNIEKFDNEVQNIFMQCSPPQQNANECAKYIENFMLAILNKYFPIKTKILKTKRLNSPWITPDIVRCIDKKHEWFRLFKTGRISHYSYKKYCNALRDLLRIAEEDYHVYKLQSLEKNSKQNWTILNGLLGRKRSNISDHFTINDRLISDPTVIANEFCNYFVEHPINIHQSILPSQNDYSNLIPFSNCNLIFDHCTPAEVYTVINKLKKDGPSSDVSVKFMKKCGMQLASMFCDLFNMCFDEAVYPDIFKCSKITPIFKKGTRTAIPNHRGIAVLCNLSKVFDSILHERLTNYFTSNGLLAGNQFGFRQNRNTELAALHLIDKILPAFEDGSYCLCVFLDFSACFDTISRDILYDKLFRYGVHGASLAFIKSYFRDRRQYVTYSNANSVIRQQDIGTIQGSKLGPRFFDIYSSDMNTIFLNDESVMYADDTALVYVGKELTDLQNHVNDMLLKVVDWCRFNKMALNPSKCEFMLFTNKHVLNEPVIRLGNDVLQRTYSFKYLGVHIDEKLKFNNQVSYIKSRLSQLCGITYRLKRYFNLKAAKNMYYACVYPLVSYCITVWGGVFCCTSKGNELQKLQSRIVRNLFQHHNEVANCCLFKANRILKLKDVYILYSCIYMFKVIKLNICPSLQSTLDLQIRDHCYGTRGNGLYVVPFPRVESVRVNYKYQYITLWNNLPNDIKDINTLPLFKKKLTEHLLEGY